MRRAPAFVVATFVFATFAVACSRQAPEGDPPPTVAVHCVLPEHVSLDETVSLRGRLQPPPGSDLAVASQVAGKVMRVNVREGQHLAAGELVAMVDDTSSRDAVRQADAALAQARAGETSADALFNRTQELVVRGIAARQELEDARAKAETSHAGVASAAAAADLAHRTLGRVQVRSTLEGVVTRVLRGPGALVDGSSSTPIVQLASAGTTEFIADATERELVSIDSGQTASIALSGGSTKLVGKVRIRSSALDPATGLGNVRVALDGPPSDAPIGAYGQVSIVTRHRDDVSVLPNSALRGAVLDGAEIVICKDGKAEVRAAKIGYRDDKRFEVVDGVAAGERAATDHVLGLESGTLIREAN